MVLPLRMHTKGIDSTGSFHFVLYIFSFPAQNIDPMSGGEATILHPSVQTLNIKDGEVGNEKEIEFLIFF